MTYNSVRFFDELKHTLLTLISAWDSQHLPNDPITATERCDLAGISIFPDVGSS